MKVIVISACFILGTQFAHALSSSCKKAMTDQAIKTAEFEYRNSGHLSAEDMEDILGGKDDLAKMKSLTCSAEARRSLFMTEARASRVQVEAYELYKKVKAEKRSEYSL